MEVIGLTGVAGSGKDTFFSLVSKYIPFKRFSLADSLKNELRVSILLKYNIDILNCSRLDKEIVRPYLVSHAKEMRANSAGRHWINILNKQIEKSNEKFICITDIRHAEYENDELYWLKEELSGSLIHISQFTKEKDAFRFIEPANDEERKNDPVLRDNSDYRIHWKTDILEAESHVQNFLKWYKKN